ncbi:hypothetical protein JYT57_01525 [Nitrosarchaeum koreense]|nr:hypothetical protein [Nitrosarchaeum koreense]
MIKRSYDQELTVKITNKNGIRYGSYKIHNIVGTVPVQAMTSVDLQRAEEADDPDLDFGTNILEIIEMEPQKLIDDVKYQREKIIEFKQNIKDNPDKLCLLAFRGIKTSFRINKIENKLLIKFQMDCGFRLIKAFFRLNTNALNDLKEFRKIITSKKKTFVACIDEKLRPKIFESLYSECITNHDDIISFFGRKLNDDNAPNFALLIEQNNDNVIRMSSMISKTNKNMINSVARNLLGFDCYSFSQQLPRDNEYFELVALDGLYFNTLTKDTPLVCVLNDENLYTSSGKFKRNQQSPYLPIYIHDIVRLNELFKIIHTKYTRKELVKLFEDRLF